MPDVPAVPGPSLTDQVAQTFAEGGALARSLPAFEARAAQRDMAAAVGETLAAGGVLMVEAGTGTGKTLAYLAPAILSRQRVLVSTGTKNLQEQIYDKDLPTLGRALGIDVRATCMKGRGNYLCLHRFDAYADAPARRPSEGYVSLDQLRRWAEQTETGDRDELVGLPDGVAFWNEISATSENCLGTECPRYQDCFVTRMRQRAAESDVVIVNHHLLCADAAVRHGAYGEVIPSASHMILDEAHQLEDVATQYFGLSTSGFKVEQLVRDAEALLLSGTVDDPPTVARLREAVQRVRDRGRRFFSALETLSDGQVGRRIEERRRVTASMLEPVAEEGDRLTGATEAFEAEVELLRDLPEDWRHLGRRARELTEQLRFLLRATDPAYVFYVERRRHGVALKASPIDVSSIIRDLLLERMDSVIMTSATLAVDGSFAYVRDRLGVGEARELLLSSEFDYARQTLVYLPSRMPEPRSPGFAAAAGRAVVDILARTRGRAFVLFTSYATLHEVEHLAAEQLPFPVLVQGSAPRSALLDEFRRTPHAVLFATSSFWQGVDVAGEALSCVIIDKLPFASPADPVTAARIEGIASRGEDPFDAYQVPQAVLTLQQGLGRLIRHRRDRGLLAILDPRILTRGYGRRFLTALPPAPVTRDPREISRFFDE